MEVLYLIITRGNCEIEKLHYKQRAKSAPTKAIIVRSTSICIDLRVFSFRVDLLRVQRRRKLNSVTPTATISHNGHIC